MQYDAVYLFNFEMVSFRVYCGLYGRYVISISSVNASARRVALKSASTGSPVSFRRLWWNSSYTVNTMKFELQHL
jgi:hypothetical protein